MPLAACWSCVCAGGGHPGGDSGHAVPLGLRSCLRLRVCLTLLTGLLAQAGVNAAPEAIVTSLIRADTAHQFNISLGGPIVHQHEFARCPAVHWACLPGWLLTAPPACLTCATCCR